MQENLSINAISLAPAAEEWLRGSHRARILHVFDGACNLIDEMGAVLSVVASGIGNGPFNIVMSDRALAFSDHLDADSEVRATPRQLILADISIKLAEARLWDPRPDWEHLHACREEIRWQLMPVSNWLTERASADCLFNLINRAVPPATMIGRNSEYLCEAVVNADILACRDAATRLAGLGPGLTPAGDDFMLGALLAAWILHPPKVAMVLAEAVADTAAPLTTTLSTAWLRSAARGEAGILWHDFLDALSSADTTARHNFAQNLLAVGHTSGADGLAGFVGVLLHEAMLQPGYCVSCA